MFYWVAIFGGVSIFFAVCFIPVIPSLVIYFANLASRKKQSIIWPAIFFCLGFSVIFIILGAGASAFGQFFETKRLFLIRLGGVVLILWAVYLLEIIPWKRLYSTHQFKTRSGGSFLMGMSFALAWFPCITPILGSILVLASLSPTFWQGVVLLILFSFGLSLPIMAVSLFFHFLRDYLQRLHRFCRYLQIITALFYAFLGFWFLLGRDFSFLNPLM